MQMSDVLNNAVDQDRGADLELIAPWDGSKTGMVLTIAGPDSTTARKSDVEMMDRLADMADDRGLVSAENRQKAAIEALAKRVLRWDVKEGDKPVPFDHAAVIVLLSVQWVREQVDAFAGDRRNFKPVR